jgi:hypothetical protein
VLDEATALLQLLPAAVYRVQQRAIEQGLRPAVVTDLATRILERIRICNTMLTPPVAVATHH